jgi:hypothetical protein
MNGCEANRVALLSSLFAVTSTPHLQSDHKIIMTTSSNTSSEMDFGIGRAPESCVSYQTDVAIIGSGYAGLAAAIVRISWEQSAGSSRMHDSPVSLSLLCTP